jgi:hypothetical protein
MAAAVATVDWATAAGTQAGPDAGAVFDATHLPPLLTMAGEPIDLAYDVVCAPGDDVAEARCAVDGTVFVRASGAAAFTALPLDQRTRAGRRQLAAVVPEGLAESAGGVDYFAVLESSALGRRLVIPPGGAAAPHVSRRLEHAVEIDLGRHAFAGDRRTGTRVAVAGWGDGPGRAGLEQGRNLEPIGAAAFDVDSQGNVLVLDQAHRRVLRWRVGARTPEHVPVSVNGTLADLAAAHDGSMFVLETTVPPDTTPRVRRFDENGRELEAIETAERSPSQIRIDARGPAVLAGVSHQWMPVFVGGTPASPDEQVRRGTVGRRFRGGVELVVLRHENEIRVALVSGRALTRAWRLTSRTRLAEVQLAEPFGQRTVVVVRVYEEGLGDEFLVLVLGRNGLVDRFAVDSADWAEAAPLGRFELVGRSLYRLGSTPEVAFVERFDLEVH